MGSLNIDRRRSDVVRNVPSRALKPPPGLEVVLPPFVLSHGFQRGKPDVAGPKKVKTEVETTKAVNAPDIIDYVNLVTKERFVPQVFRAEMTDGALQFTLLHIAAPETLAFLFIDLDEE